MNDTHYYEIETLYGIRYGISAFGECEDYRPHVSVLDKNGEAVRTIVDSEQTDETYTTPRECLQRAIAHVI